MWIKTMREMNSSIQNNISDLLKLARKFNCFYLSGLHQGTCKPFVVAGHQVGLIRPDVMKHLQRFPEVFRITGRHVELNPAFRDYKERTTKVADVLMKLKKEEDICALKGWRDETNPAVSHVSKASTNCDHFSLSPLHQPLHVPPQNSQMTYLDSF